MTAAEGPATRGLTTPHGYDRWESGVAHCLCGSWFDTVQALDTHVRADLSAKGLTPAEGPATVTPQVGRTDLGYGARWENHRGCDGRVHPAIGPGCRFGSRLRDDVCQPAEGPATVTLTDDERARVSMAHPSRRIEAVERIVAERVADLTADLAAAREANDEWRAMYERRAAAYFQANDQKRELEQALANVRALAAEWEQGAETYSTIYGDRLRALLPAAPTGEQGGDDR